MRLALAIGCTVGELEQRMDQREFVLWQLYDQRYRLPHRHFELLLANISRWLALDRGHNKPLQEFLFDSPPVPESVAGAGALALGEISGRKVIKLGQGRKRA